IPAVIWLTIRPYTRRSAMVALVSASGPVISYLIIKLTPLGPLLNRQDADRLAPLQFLRMNSKELWEVIQTYLPLIYPMAVVAFAGVRERLSALVVCVAMLAMWMLPWPLLSNFAPSRYYMPAVPVLCALVAAGMGYLVARMPTKNSRVSVGVMM